jgi:hypothetical protein
MSQNVWVDPRIQQVRAEQVRAYLLARGWHPEPYPGPELLVFAGPVDDDGQPVIQILPSSEQMRDYSMRLEELVTALSIMEDRPAAEVLTDMLRLPATPPPAAGLLDGTPATPPAR